MICSIYMISSYKIRYLIVTVSNVIQLFSNTLNSFKTLIMKNNCNICILYFLCRIHCTCLPSPISLECHKLYLTYNVECFSTDKDRSQFQWWSLIFCSQMSSTQQQQKLHYIYSVEKKFDDNNIKNAYDYFNLNTVTYAPRIFKHFIWSREEVWAF